MQKMINNKLIDLTEDEIQEVQQRQAAWEANEIPRTIESVLEAVRAHICKIATERGYINCTNCASFQNSAIQSMKADADIFVLWRDAVWNLVMEQIDLYKESGRNFDDIPAFIQELPGITWPEAGV